MRRERNEERAYEALELGDNVDLLEHEGHAGMGREGHREDGLVEVEGGEGLLPLLPLSCLCRIVLSLDLLLDRLGLGLRAGLERIEEIELEIEGGEPLQMNATARSRPP